MLKAAAASPAEDLHLRERAHARRTQKRHLYA